MGHVSLRGHLLLSAPQMQDPNFMHTVVLICQHDENGAFGLTVNRKSGALVADVFPDHQVLHDLQLSLRSGGPVRPDALQILHRLPAGIGHGAGHVDVDGAAATPKPEDLVPDNGEDELSPAGVEIAPGIHLGADLDQAADFLAHASVMAEAHDGSHGRAPHPDAYARFVVGYSGWGEGQLDAEMTTGSWLPIPASPDLVFSEESGEAVWRAALARVPGGGSSLAHLPPDPSWN